MMFKKMIRSAVVAGIAALGVAGAQAADITGAGATFPYPIYAKWADSYKAETGNALNYASVGSGAGIKQIQAKTVTFGATDAPLTAEQLTKDGLAQFPMVMGGVGCAGGAADRSALGSSAAELPPPPQAARTTAAAAIGMSSARGAIRRMDTPSARIASRIRARWRRTRRRSGLLRWRRCRRRISNRATSAL